VTQLIPLVDSIPPIAGKVGHPIQRPGELFGDRAYDSNPHREQLRQRGIEPTIAERNTEHGSGLGILRMILAFLRVLLGSRAALAAENLALRQQLLVLQRSAKRPRFRKSDRIFWSLLSHLWSGWRSALLIVQPATVVRWHRQCFKLYWRWKSGKKLGRPLVDREIRDLIRRMSQENPTWGVPRILSELLLLGHAVAESTVNKYMVGQPRPPSQNWRTFLANHVGQIAAIDFFTVATITFRVLYVFLVLRYDRRRVAHFNVTTNPTAQWAAQQIVEAFPFEEVPRFLLRDRDGIYGPHFRDRVEHMG